MFRDCVLRHIPFTYGGTCHAARHFNSRTQGGVGGFPESAQERPVVGEDSLQSSIDEVGIFQLSIVDLTLTDDEAVERRAEIELNKHAEAAEQITLVTNQDGAQPGQLMSLTNSIHNLAGNRLIDRILIRPLSDTLQESELSLRLIKGST